MAKEAWLAIVLIKVVILTLSEEVKAGGALSTVHSDNSALEHQVTPRVTRCPSEMSRSEVCFLSGTLNSDPHSSTSEHHT
jgi:hypothetical protein